MPTAAPHPCARPGCRTLVPRGSRYCAPHAKAHRQAEDERRGTREERGYDWTWRTRIRPAALSREPLCRMCAEVGIVTAATQVDHIDGNSRNNDPSNLRALCHSCHSRRTARDQAWGRGGAKV